MDWPTPSSSFRRFRPSLTASRVRRVLVAVVSASVVCVMLSQTVAKAQPLRGPRAGIAARSESRHAVRSLSARCVALGLKPISAKLTLFLAGDSAVHIPVLRVSWSGKPLPKRCKMRTVMAVRARVRFPKTGHTLEFGPEYSSRWSVFWLGRTHVHNAERTYHGPAVTFNLGCVEDPRAWLRYEVLGRGGRSLARLVRPVPVSSEICQR
jgi:hypothetical protein